MPAVCPHRHTRREAIYWGACWSEGSACGCVGSGLFGDLAGHTEGGREEGRRLATPCSLRSVDHVSVCSPGRTYDDGDDNNNTCTMRYGTAPSRRNVGISPFIILTWEACRSTRMQNHRGLMPRTLMRHPRETRLDISLMLAMKDILETPNWPWDGDGQL